MHNGIQYKDQGGVQMKVLSAAKLSKTILELRNKKNITQEKLGELTGINRVIISRIERENFIPSIEQLESLARVLEFDITDMFIEKDQSSSFVALRSENMSDKSKEGLEHMLNMMGSLRQQIKLRRKYEDGRK
jgi:transcriptional regulator with XRE-family HTH domain